MKLSTYNNYLVFKDEVLVQYIIKKMKLNIY